MLSILEYSISLLNKNRENYWFYRLSMMIVYLRSVNDCLHNSCGPATIRRQKVAIDFSFCIIPFSNMWDSIVEEFERLKDRFRLLLQ